MFLLTKLSQYLLRKLSVKSELPSLYKCYVDDTLAIIPDLNEANIFLDKLNCCLRNLKLTMEIAELNTIPFVGMKITKSGNRLETSVYRKSTNTPALSQPCGQTLQRLLTHHYDPSCISAVIYSYCVFC